MRKNKKLDFLLTVCLTLEIGGLIALFVGIVLKLFAAMFGGAISVICACLIILLNADEIAAYIAGSISSALYEENAGD